MPILKPAVDDQAPFLTLEEVADLLRVSPWTVKRAIRLRELRAARISALQFRIRREDVEAYFDACADVVAVAEG